MKIFTHISFVAGCCALVLSLSSCELFQKSVKTEAQLPTDRETVISQTAESYRSQALERGEMSGYWVIREVAGKEAVGEEPPYLKFDKSNSRVYGNNGCNILNSDYKSNPADSTLTFTNTITTMRACNTPGLTDIEINTALAATAHYTWHREGNRYTVTLLSEAGAPLMSLIHQNYEFLNGTWTVKYIGNKAVANTNIKLVIDVEEQKIHGNTGCNILNGTLITDMFEDGAVTFTNLGVTRMSCPDMDDETELLVALEEVCTARPVDANTVNLLDGHDQTVLTLSRVRD